MLPAPCTPPFAVYHLDLLKVIIRKGIFDDQWRMQGAEEEGQTERFGGGGGNYSATAPKECAVISSLAWGATMYTMAQQSHDEEDLIYIQKCQVRARARAVCLVASGGGLCVRAWLDHPPPPLKMPAVSGPRGKNTSCACSPCGLPGPTGSWRCWWWWWWWVSGGE
jgi:hypothetical protein